MKILNLQSLPGASSLCTIARIMALALLLYLYIQSLKGGFLRFKHSLFDAKLMCWLQTQWC